MVLPDASGVTPEEFTRYATELSRVHAVSSVSAPGGTFVHGAPAGPSSAPTGVKDGSAFLTVTSTAPLFSDASASQLDRAARRRNPGPQDRADGGSRTG